MAIAIDGDGIGVSALSTAAKAELKSGRKNLIINGGFDVWQRGTSQSTGGYGSADRWFMHGTSTTAMAQVTDTPKSYFNYALKITTGASPSDYIVRYRVEDLDTILSDTTRSFTISFWAKASASTTMAVVLINTLNSGDFNLTTSWQRFTYTFNGESTTNNHIDFETTFSSGDVYLSGVQLELGDTATDFEHRSYGEELALCQRYWQKHYCAGAGVQNNSTAAFTVTHLPVTMRNRPTLSTNSGVWTNINLEHDDTYDVTTGYVAHGSTDGDLDSMSSFILQFNTSGSNTVGYGIVAVCDKNADFFTYDAEL